jgi:predicted transcriptional regulator
MAKTTEQERFVRLPASLYRELAELARDEDRSVASAARTVVREGLARRKATATVRNGLRREAAHG